MSFKLLYNKSTLDLLRSPLFWLLLSSLLSLSVITFDFFLSEAKIDVDLVF